MQNQTRIDVVCAVIVREDVVNKGRDDLCLIAKRTKEKTSPDLWEFVGGKVEREEKHSDSIKGRSLRNWVWRLKSRDLKNQSVTPTITPRSGSGHICVNSLTTVTSQRNQINISIII